MKCCRRMIVIALMVAGVLTMGSAAPVVNDEGPGDTELAARQKFIRAQFLKLTAKMLEVAKLVEKTEPQTAKALQQAVDQSKRAFVAEDMDKVAEYLSKGLATAAAGTKQEVIKELQKILEVLRYGTINIDKRVDRIKEWETALIQLRKAIKKQEGLEQRSRLANQAGKIDKQGKKLSTDLAAVIAKQKKLLDETQKLEPGSPEVRRLVALRDKVGELIAEHEKIKVAAAKAPVDKLPLAGKAQKDLAEKTNKVKNELAAAAKDLALSKALSKAGASSKAISAAAKKVAQAAGEMNKAAKALNKSDAKAARGPQEQAGIDLKDAQKKLDEAVKKCGQRTPSGELAKEQRDLAEQTKELSEAVKKAAENAGMDAKAASMAKAGGHMGKAAKKLSSQDPKAAAKEQRAALKELEDKKQKLAQLFRRALEKARQPLNKQEEDQAKLASQTSELSSQMKQSPSGSAPGQASVSSASKSMGQASKQLGQNDPKSANKSQNDALEELKKAAEQLARAIDQEKEMVQAEQLAKIDAMIQRILKTQKTISSGTKEAWAKRAGDGYGRPEQLRLSELSEGEGRLAEDVKAVRKMLLKEGTTAVFPAVLEEVRTDMGNVQKRLADMNAGKVTQAVQRQIERNLEQMLEALRKERSRRRRSGMRMAGGGSGAGGGAGGRKQPLVPPAAELKMLKLLEIQVRERTVLLDKQRAKNGDSKALKEQHKILAKRQDKLRKITMDMKKKLRPKPVGDIERGGL